MRQTEVNIQVVNKDLEGELVEIIEGQGKHYGKRLSLSVAWHIENPEILDADLDGLVSHVEQNWEERTLIIHYHPFVKPLQQEKLQALLSVEQPLAEWRLAQLAANLCQRLEELHAIGVPQLLIHPDRIGLMDREFVILPSFASILSPFSQLLSRPETWARLPYLAPEIIRTRGNRIDLLAKGDIYALGKTLQALVIPSSVDIKDVDPYDFLEQLIESPSTLPELVWPPGFTKVANLVKQMCALPLENRPEIGYLVSAFRALVKESDAEVTISQLIKVKQLTKAKQYLSILQDSYKDGMFSIPMSKIHMLWADVALAYKPPQFMQAIDKLKRAASFEPKSAIIHQRIARTYRLHEQHSQHLKLADLSYREALRLSDWQASLVEEWLEVLQQVSPESLLDHTEQIPWDKRTATVFQQRAASFLKIGKPDRSWYECIDYFVKFNFNQSVYEIAQHAAASLSLTDLILWKQNRHDIDRIPAALSIIWARSGNLEKAANYYALALVHNQNIM
jgi:hypothetical protein